MGRYLDLLETVTPKPGLPRRFPRAENSENVASIIDYEVFKEVSAFTAHVRTRGESRLKGADQKRTYALTRKTLKLRFPPLLASSTRARKHAITLRRSVHRSYCATDAA
jgi:hypothetical protein